MNSSDFQEIIGYEFKNKKLMQKALTHSSYVSHIAKGEERATQNNERLEFLGDAFFDAIVSAELYARLPNSEEGVLTKLRAKVVCEDSLAEEGRKLNIGAYIRMGKGEEKNGGRNLDSIIADALEAVIGAIYLDGGYEEAKGFVIRNFEVKIDSAVSGKLGKDYKSIIQEREQAMGGRPIVYKIVDEQGPDHAKVFFVELSIEGKVIGHGEGRTKKEAERNAAKEAVERGGELVF